MQQKIRRFLVSLIIALTLTSFLNAFKNDQLTPSLEGVPYIFWSGFFITVLVVLATHLTSKILPYSERVKP